MSARITWRRAWIAMGVTAYQVPVVAACVTYFAVLNGKAEDFCLFGWNPNAFDSWRECVLSYNSIVGHWGYWAKVLAIGYTGVSVLMLGIWWCASFVAARQRKAHVIPEIPLPAAASCRRRHTISYEAAAIVLIWSLAFASVSGFFPLVAMMLVFALATAFTLARRVIEVALRPTA